ncbi:hypothetical protein BC829DRAFT_448217 [Chytridium lagenaria]|nr:hypothetical protein BC829DRAFT_448217 [Chytridium lagenaria]
MAAAASTVHWSRQIQLLLTARGLKGWLVSSPDLAKADEVMADAQACLLITGHIEDDFAVTIYSRTGKDDPTSKDIWTALGLTATSSQLVDFTPLLHRFLAMRFAPKTQINVAMGGDLITPKHASYHAFVLVHAMDDCNHAAIKAICASFLSVPSTTLTETIVYRAFEQCLRGLPSPGAIPAIPQMAASATTGSIKKDEILYHLWPEGSPC